MTPASVLDIEDGDVVLDLSLIHILSSTLHSLADQFVTILLSSVLTSTIWSWYLRESDYSLSLIHI